MLGDPRFDPHCLAGPFLTKCYKLKTLTRPEATDLDSNFALEWRCEGVHAEALGVGGEGGSMAKASKNLTNYLMRGQQRVRPRFDLVDCPPPPRPPLGALKEWTLRPGRRRAPTNHDGRAAYGARVVITG